MPRHQPSPQAGSLDPQRKHAVLVSAALVSRRREDLAQSLREASRQALTPAELVELILQSLLFDGYPCALEGLIMLKELKIADLPAPETIELYSQPNLELWEERGIGLCRRIYGDNFERLLQNVSDLSPTLREWMLHEGYGRVLARPTLPIDVREMGIIAILTVKGYPRQLHSHLRGAHRVGVSRSQLREAIHLCDRFTAADQLQQALDVLEKLA